MTPVTAVTGVVPALATTSGQLVDFSDLDYSIRFVTVPVFLSKSTPPERPAPVSLHTDPPRLFSSERSPEVVSPHA